MRRPAAGLATALLIAGCAIFESGVPDWVANRQPLEACAAGVVAADSAEAGAAQRCMLNAYRNGRGAELITAGKMATGDPLVSYLRVHENGTIEIFHSLGDDPDAPGAWERMRCEELAPPRDGDPDPQILTIGGCEMLPVP
jgi:hypothetical protein